MIKSILNICRDIVTGWLAVSFRYRYWKLFLKEIGENVKFFGNIKVLEPENISIGDNCSLNDYVLHNARAEIVIGNNVTLSSGVSIITAGLKYGAYEQELFRKKTHFGEKIIIEDNVWIGSESLILPGVTIGKNSVIGGGAVVTKGIPPNSVAVGVPAKVTKKKSIDTRLLIYLKDLINC